MILDYDDELTDNAPVVAGKTGQAITATASSNRPKDALVARDWGAGEPIPLYMRVTEAFNTLTSLTTDIEGWDDTARTNPVTYIAGTAIVLASLTLNKLLLLGFIPPGLTVKRVLGARFTVTGSNPTLGRLRVGVVDDEGRPQNLVTSI